MLFYGSGLYTCSVEELLKYMKFWFEAMTVYIIVTFLTKMKL